MEENVNDFTQSPIPEFGSSMQPIVQGVLSGLNTVGGGIANIAKKEEEKKRELKQRLETSPDVYDLEQSEIDELVDGPTGLNATVKARINDNSFDINKDIDEDLQLRKQSQQIQNLAKISQANQEYYEQKKAEFLESPEKWVAADFDAWEKEYTDSALTIQKRQKLRIEKDPLVEKEDVYDLVARPVFPGFSEERDEKGDYVKFVDEENHAASILRYIQTGKGAKLYDQYKDPNETKEDFAKRMADDFQENYWPDIKKHHIPRVRRSTSGRTSTTQWEASPARENKYGGDPTNYNAITFKAGRAKVTLTDDDGKVWSASSMIAHYDAATNKYVIEAKVKDEEGFETTKTFKMSENPGDDGNLNYEAVNDVLPPNQSLKDLFNRPIKSSAPKKAATTGTKKANGFPDVDINK
jgi:hypothetical protein